MPVDNPEGRRVTDPVNVPRWDGRVRAVAFVWRLTKGKNFATCELWTRF